MNRILRVLTFAVLTCAFSAAASGQEMKLAVFDAQAVSENTEMGKRIQAELTAFTERKEAEIGERQKLVGEMRKQLSQQSLSLSADRRGEMEKEIQRQMLELQSMQEAASRELELEYQSATKEFQEKLILAIETFGRDEGFTMILDRSQVAWFNASVDVTSGVIDRFNKMFTMTAAAGE